MKNINSVLSTDWMVLQKHHQLVTLAFHMRMYLNKLFPKKKKQAIIFDTINHSKLGKYIMAAIENIVAPKNITAASRISNNRICLYLSLEAIADSFIEEYKWITIQDTFAVPTKRSFFFQQWTANYYCMEWNVTIKLKTRPLSCGFVNCWTSVSRKNTLEKMNNTFATCHN